MPQPTTPINPRYRRHLSLPGVGPEGQARLAAARVLVVGLGGLGCPSALYLTAAGVGTLGLADFDRVEESNLQRQVLYNEADVGHLKIECAAAALSRKNSDLKIELHEAGITQENALDLFSRYDLVLDGSDNFATRYLLNDAAFFAGVPLISASLFQFEAQVTLYHPRGGGPCHRCLFPDVPAPGETPNCAEAGVFGALCGVAGSLQAVEALKWITGAGEPLLGAMLACDAWTGHCRRLRIERNPDCPLCGKTPTITTLVTAASAACAVDGEEIDPRDVDTFADPLFVDVREDWEWEQTHVEGARHIPLARLADEMETLPRDRALIVYCQLGQRSLRALRLLRGAGFAGARSLAGGIERWAREHPPTRKQN